MERRRSQEKYPPTRQRVWKHGCPKNEYPPESWKFGHSGSKSRPFRHGFRVGEYSGSRQKVWRAKSTIAVTDRSRRCTLGNPPISRRIDGPYRQYFFLDTAVSGDMGSAARILPRKLEISKFRTPNRTVLTWILGMWVQWGASRKFGRRN